MNTKTLILFTLLSLNQLSAQQIVVPQKLDASSYYSNSFYASNPVENIIDGDLKTSWKPRREGEKAINEHIKLTYQGQIEFKKIILTQPKYSTAHFVKYRRISEVELTVGSEFKKTYQLKDNSSPHTLKIPKIQGASLQLKILSLHEEYGVGSGQGKVGISELVTYGQPFYHDGFTNAQKIMSYVESDDILTFSKEIKKLDTDYLREGNFHSTSLLGYLINNGKPYYVEELLKNKFKLPYNEFQTREQAINKAWDNKKLRPEVEEVLDRIAEKGSSSDRNFAVSQRKKDQSKLIDVSEKDYYDSLWISDYFQRRTSNSHKSTIDKATDFNDIMFLLRSNEFGYQNLSRSSKQIFEQLFDTNVPRMFKDAIDEYVSTLRFTTNTVKDFNRFFDLHNIYYQLHISEKSDYNGFLAKLNMQDFYEYKNIYYDTKCALLNSGELDSILNSSGESFPPVIDKIFFNGLKSDWNSGHSYGSPFDVCTSYSTLSKQYRELVERGIKTRRAKAEKRNSEITFNPSGSKLKIETEGYDPVNFVLYDPKNTLDRRLSKHYLEFSRIETFLIELFNGRFENISKLELDKSFWFKHNSFLIAYSFQFEDDIKNPEILSYSYERESSSFYDKQNIDYYMEPRFAEEFSNRINEYQVRVTNSLIKEIRSILRGYNASDIEIRQLVENLYRFSKDIEPAKTLSDIK